MKIIFSIIISIFLSLCLSYFLFFQRLPESMQLEGYLNFLTDKNALGGLIGGFIGMMAIMLTVVLPFLTNLPSMFHDYFNARKLSERPLSSLGRIMHMKKNGENSILEIFYKNHTKSFDVPNALLTEDLSEGSSVTVLYDPNDINNSYLDLSSNINNSTTEISNSNTVFKILELTPKFAITPKSYEIIGEIHGDKYQGQKASLIYELNNNELKTLVPGKIYPCFISGDNDNYRIDIELN